MDQLSLKILSGKKQNIIFLALKFFHFNIYYKGGRITDPCSPLNRMERTGVG